MAKVDIRQRAFTVLTGIPVPIKSLGSTTDPYGNNPKFTLFTNGHTQKELMDFWDTHRPPGDRRTLTTCMDFVNHYCQMMGFRDQLGGFNYRSVLKLHNLEHAWIDSAPGLLPSYGDILWHEPEKKSDDPHHIDVAMEFDGFSLWRMASGQGGPDRDGAGAPKPFTSFDKVDKVTSTKQGLEIGYDAMRLRGWIDIELAWRQEQPAPQWLIGWWQHVFDDSGDTYYYFYGKNRVVHWTQVPPMGPLIQVFPTDGGVGVFTNDEPDDHVSIKWNSGSTEDYQWQSDNVMTGTYKSDTLTATKVT